MFQKLSLIILLSFVLTNVTSAQVVPDGIIFQAVAKDRNGNAANGRTIYAVVSILATQNIDSKVYTERFVLLSNADGVFTLVIGKGSRLSGASSLTDIPWDKPYYLNVKIAIAPSIENTIWQEDKEYLDLGISQFWSVPYAFYSSNSFTTESAKTLSSTLSSNKGGTGVDNKGKTFTYQNNVAVMGSGDLTITTTKASNITFPSTGTLSTLSGAEILSNKTLQSPRLTGLASSITPNIDSRDSSIATTLFVDSLLTIQLAKTASSLTDSLLKSIVIIDSTLQTKTNYSDTALILSNYLSALNNLRTTKLNAVDTTLMLTNYLAALNNLRSTKLNAVDTANLAKWKFNSADTILLSKRIDLKLDTTDFHLMIAPYLKKMNGVSYADTASLLAPYLTGLIALNKDTTTLQDRLDLRLAKSDTSTMLTPYLAALNNLRATKLNATDTSTMLTNYLAALNNLRTTKLNATDTSGMLTPYLTGLIALNKDTTTLQTRLGLRLANGDTSTMLAPYLTALNYLRTTKLNALDTTVMLNPYLREVIDMRSAKLNAVDTTNLAKWKFNSADTILLSKRIDLKLDTTDFHLMIAPYLKKMNGVSYADTASLLAPYLAEVIDLRDKKLNATDTSVMLAPYLTGLIALNKDTTTLQDRLDLRLAKGDTSTMLTPYLAALNNLRATKLNATDTSGMLEPYLTGLIALNKDTTTLQDRLGLRLAKGDTATMLAPYLREAINLHTTKLNATDTANLSIWKLNAADTASLSRFKLNIVDTANLLQKKDTIYLSNRIEALALSSGIVSSEKLPIADTTKVLAPYLAELIDLRRFKVNYSDTSAMLNPYLNTLIASVKYSDTTSMLRSYLNELVQLGVNKLNKSDTAGMLTPYLNTLINSVKYTDTANILSNYLSSLNDLRNTKLNFSDTAALLNNYLAALNNLRSTKLNATDTFNLSTWKLNKTDTTAMLANYLASLNNLRNTKLNYTDTASMLTNYLAALNVLRNTKINATDTALMLDNYRNRINFLMDDNATLSTRFNAKENVINKSTNFINDAGSDIKYPSVRTAKNYVDDQIIANATPDASLTVKGRIMLSGDLGGNADNPAVQLVGGSTSSEINTATILANGATSANTPNKIVKRDASGNFSAGTITATLSGNATNVSGVVLGANGGTGVSNSGKTVTLGGNIITQGNFTLSGANALTLNTTNATNIYLPASGTLATLNGAENLLNKTINGITPSTQASGFSLVGGTSAKTLIVNNDATISGTNTGDQTISLTGDVTGSGLGSFQTSLALSGVTPGTYGAATQTPVFTVDGKGRLTSVSNTTISGVSTIGSQLESGKIIVGDFNNLAAKVPMTGDVTIDDMGITTISNNAITNIKIGAGEVSYSKIQQASASDVVLGRISVGAGQLEEISTIGTGGVVREISPTFQGVPQVPLAAITSNDLTIANTQFVTRAVAGINVSNITGILPGANGGTGINNAGKTITLGGNFFTVGNFPVKLRFSGSTDLNLPTSGTLATLSDITGGVITGGQISGTIKPSNGGTGIANSDDKTITLGGAIVFDGANSSTIRTTANTDITLPTTGTIATLAGSEIITNKTISAIDNTIQNISNANISATAGIKDTKLDNITTAGKVANTATTATSANTSSAIVSRDANGDFSARIISGTLNGNAASANKLATTINVYGNDFDGTTNLGQVISSQYGGTGNAFVKFIGPSLAIKNYTLPDVDATILTTNTQVTPAQGGTGVSTANANLVFAGPINGTATAPGFRALVAADLPSGSSQYINNSTLQQSSANFNISGAGILGGDITAASFKIPSGFASQFLKADGSVDANAYVTLDGTEALTNKTINGISLTPSLTGFSIAGGIASKILTVNDGASISGDNTGDISLTGQNYLSITNQTLSANPINLAGTHITGTLAAARFPGLLGDITNSVGTLNTTISNAAITSSKIAAKAVDFSKVQDISMKTLLGNSSDISAGSIHEIKIGSGLNMDPNTQTLSASGSGGTVTGVTATSPIISSGGNAPVISIPLATTSTNGYLSATDWNTFNSKQAAGTFLSGTVSIANGGTGATDIVNARANLGLAIGTDILAQRTFGTAANSAIEDFSPVIGSSSLTTLGTITTGEWQGTKITDGFINSASTWNAKENALTFTAPLNRSTNTISIPLANTSTSGYLSATDWNTFNAKQGAISLTTTGTSGAATISGTTINIPQYTGGGTVTSVNVANNTISNDISLTIDPTTKTTTPIITLNVPDAASDARGVINTGTQTIAGAKTFTTLPTFSTLTAGSLLFAGTGGAINQNNSNLFWDNTNTRLGIGTATPSTKLNVVGTSKFEGPTFVAGSIAATANNDVLVGMDINPTFTNAGAFTGVNNIGLRVGSATSFLKVYPKWSGGTAGIWLDMSTDGPSGIGSGGAGANAWIAYVSGNGNYFTNSTAGDIVYRNGFGKLLFGNTAGAAGMALVNNHLVINSVADAGYNFDVIGTSRHNGQTTITGTTTATSGAALGIIATPTLTATASNDVLVGMDINPTFTTGVYSATTNAIGLRVQGVGIGTGNGNIASNTVVGFGSLSKNLYGGSNTAVGFNAMLKVTGELGSGSKGWWNTAVGSNALYNNVLSAFNTAVGSGALFANTANNNTAVGTSSLTSNTTGSDNTAVGTNALLNLNTGSNDIGIGSSAGRYISGGTTILTSASNSIFIGNYSYPLADAQTNQIVIGNAAVGLGDNSTVIGNSSTTKAKIFGALQVTAGIQSTGSVQSAGSIVAIKSTPVTSAYTITATDQIITVNASTSALTVTLPTAVGNTGQTYTIKKIDTSANAVTVSTISATPIQNIDASSTYTLGASYKYVTVVSDGANWMIVGGN